MKRGYVKLYRKSLDSRVFQNEGLLKVFVWCLLRANHKATWVSIQVGRGQTEVFLKPGQFIFGRDSAARELKMKPSTAWKRINKLKQLKILSLKSNSQYSIITVINWDTYQSKEEKSNSQVTTKEQPGNTDKNDKNDKYIYMSEFFNVTETQHKKYNDAYPLLDLPGEYRKMTAWIESNPSKRKTEKGYPRFVNSWLSKAAEKKRNSGETNWRYKLKRIRPGGILE